MLVLIPVLYPRYSFQLDLTYHGHSPEIKAQIIDMALNGSAIRDTAQVLRNPFG